MRAVDRRRRVAQRFARREIERDRRGDILALMIDRERRLPGRVMGERRQRHHVSAEVDDRGAGRGAAVAGRAMRACAAVRTALLAARWRRGGCSRAAWSRSASGTDVAGERDATIVRRRRMSALAAEAAARGRGCDGRRRRGGRGDERRGEPPAATALSCGGLRAAGPAPPEVLTQICFSDRRALPVSAARPPSRRDTG